MSDSTFIPLPTLDAQLAKESRSCPSCGLHVPSPFVERCPRCYTLLPHVPTDCPGCIHKITCPQAKVEGK